MSKRRARGLLAVALAMALLTAACGDSGADGDGAAPGRLEVVATTSIMGDLVDNIVDGDADVTVLIPIGADPHDYQPSAQQVAAITTADLVVANGLRLEEGLDDILEAAAGDGANILSVGELVDPIPFADRGESAADSHVLDPHVWNDPLRMAVAAEIVGAELARLDSAVDWASRAAGFAAELRARDVVIQDILSSVPAQSRVLVTNHESMGYFADRYDFTVIGVVIPGGSTLAAPSSADVAALVATVRAANVGAIFAETTDSTMLADAVAAEAGQAIDVVEIFSGSLGEPGSGAETLLAMLTTNAGRIAVALS